MPLAASRRWSVHSHSSVVSRPPLVSGLGGRGPFTSAHSDLAQEGQPGSHGDLSLDPAPPLSTAHETESTEPDLAPSPRLRQ